MFKMPKRSLSLLKCKTRFFFVGLLTLRGQIGIDPSQSQLNHFFIHLPLEFLPVSGPLMQWCASTLGTALLCSSRAGIWFGAYVRFAIIDHRDITIITGYIYKHDLIGSRQGLNPGHFNLESPALPSELPGFGNSTIYVTSFSNISLCLIFFGEQQLANGMDKEGDLMRFNTNRNILYEV